MRTSISSQNPFGYNRYGYLWETLSRHGSARHLDYGAYEGEVLRKLVSSNVVKHGFGVDANRAAVARSRLTGAHLVPITPGSFVPFVDGAFTSVSLLDVLEHVVDQPGLLRELRRVLAPKGRLVVTVPGRYPLSFLDTGNWKFYFPKLHRLFFSLVKGPDTYRRRYLACENGLFGDLEVGKTCHEHFDLRTLSRLLEANGFTIEDTDGAGFFDRLAVLVRIALPRRLHGLVDHSIEWDAERFASAHLFVSAVAASSQNTDIPNG